MLSILPNIELSSREYDYLINFDNCYDFGSEAGIIRDEGRYAIKIFRKDFGQWDKNADEIEEIRENKLQKLILLYGMKDFDNRLKPINTFSYNGRIVGYREIFLECQTLFGTFLTTSEKKYYLKLIREKLDIFHKLGIVYGDVNGSNIFIDERNEEVVFCDIDNMKVLDCPSDMVNDLATEFLDCYGIVDEKLDSYMMNLLTLEQFGFECDDNILGALKIKEIPKMLENDKNKRLLKEMSCVRKSYSGGYLIDNL